MTAEDMTDDFVLDWESSASVHKTLYTPTAAREIGWAACVYCGSVGLLVITLWLAVRSGAPRSWRSLLRLLPVAAILSSAIGLATYAFVPRTTAGAGKAVQGIMAHMDRESSMRAYVELLIDVAVGRITPDFEAFDQWWPRQLAERRPDLSFPPLDIPGGYTLEQDGSDWVLTVYDSYATPLRMLVKAMQPSDDAQSVVKSGPSTLSLKLHARVE